jgi:hypothetical protein
MWLMDRVLSIGVAIIASAALVATTTPLGGSVVESLRNVQMPKITLPSVQLPQLGSTAAAPAATKSPNATVGTTTSITPTRATAPQPSASKSLALKPSANLSPITDQTPFTKLIPDSELVNSPSAVGFNIKSYLDGRGGYASRYTETVWWGERLTAAQIIQRVSEQFSVHPRLLIALLEYEGGWVTSDRLTREQVLQPLKNVDPTRSGKLYYQLTWAAARLNEGYYGWRNGNRTFVQIGDKNQYAAVPSGLNAGTVGLQNYLAAVHPRASWDKVMGTDTGSFLRTYGSLFGDPMQYDRGVLVPDGLRQPEFRLPWTDGERWHYTGGPHDSWGDGSPWGAVDFTSQTPTGCQPLPEWTLSMSDGLVTRSTNGEVVVSMDPARDDRVGWSVLYMHIHSSGRVKVGSVIKAGDRIGHGSCEGGQAVAAHVHIARKYNGEWLPSVGSVPFVIGGWLVTETTGEFQGEMIKDGVVHTADESRRIELNGVP